MWIFIALLFGVFVWLNFHSRRPSLRVLMYHKVALSGADALTVTSRQLYQQLLFLREAGYQFVSLAEVIDSLGNSARPLPARSVLVTFDDAYENNQSCALPILQELQVPATIFVPTAFVGGTNTWDDGTEPLLTKESLQQLSSEGITLAYHSHRHLNFKTEALSLIQADLTANVEAAAELGLPMLPALAYPYGGRPKESLARKEVINAIKQRGIRAAFRIGNRLNPLPIRNPYEINRIDVRGTFTMGQFRHRVKWGKLV